MKNFNYIKNKKIFFIISAIILVVGITSFIFKGFYLDTDFVGGTTLEYSMNCPISVEEADVISGYVEEITGIRPSSVQRSQNAENPKNNDILIKITEIATEGRDAVFAKLSEVYGITEKDILQSTNVGASMSADIRRAAIMATVIAVVLMLVYITIRFDVTSGISAVICLAHDLFVMVTAYSLFSIPLNSTMIAALLTILGYSINATIIIFDRIRENKRLHPEYSVDESANAGIRSTFTRSLNTTITTLLTIGTIYILGVASIREFALPLIIGIISGFYSSVFLAAPIWSVTKKAFSGKQKAK
ncbi:MAG: protein translocase subunit SecF [Clostridia bacterium]|nr:protein translocase subunit SecF [Clostridia bacterium]